MHPSEPYFFDLVDKPKRDLWWAIKSPSLLDCDWSPAAPAWLINQLARMPHAGQWPLPPGCNHSRLGLVFESLWHHWLEQTGWRWQANLHISAAGKTLGELDVLFDDGQQQRHLELALKFYLGYGNGADSEWIGPNRRDRLRRKLDHSRDHQLPLAATAAARPQLQSHNWAINESSALMRGCLFWPCDQSQQPELPVEANPAHWSGFWCHARDIRRYLTDGHWVILARDEWLSPVVAQKVVSAERLCELLAIHFRYLEVPLAIARMEQLDRQPDDQANEQRWGEQQRGMVVCDRWPLN
ncbi:DUF1853 family protein [Oceanobacter mangrovi]|uniref:DUF1853 family protein n=1 Tax=Oceanobacter mangrovi TaxID=2862510 RepID=UPI001C8D8CA1|nr:DUF1853 family protein [Oceanobacter mangrovi]